MHNNNNPVRLKVTKVTVAVDADDVNPTPGETHLSKTDNFANSRVI